MVLLGPVSARVEELSGDCGHKVAGPPSHPQDLLSLPGPLGERVKRMSDAVPNARGQREEKEYFIAPVLLPLPPARFYFLFGAPVETDTLPGRGKEKEPAEKMYQEVRQEGGREGREQGTQIHLLIWLLNCIM